jgi:hypothetical protein
VNPGLREGRFEKSEHAFGELVQIGGAYVGLRPAAPVEPRADDAGHPIHLCEQQPHPLDGLRLTRGHQVIAEELEVSADRIERSPDLVGERRCGLLHQGQPVEPAGPLLQREQRRPRLALAFPLGERLAQLVVPAREQPELERPDLRRRRCALGAPVGSCHGLA